MVRLEGASSRGKEDKEEKRENDRGEDARSSALKAGGNLALWG